MRSVIMLMYVAAAATGYFASCAGLVWLSWDGALTLAALIAWQMSALFLHLRDLRAAEARGVMIGIKAAMHFAKMVSDEQKGK